MRAMAIDTTGGPDALTLREIPRPGRINAEVIVRVIAAGINPIDAKMTVLSDFPQFCSSIFPGSRG